MIFVWLCIISLLVFVDQLSKWLAVIFLQGSEAVSVIPWFIQFDFLEGGNTGAAWGMFGEPGQRWIFITISTVAILAIFAYLIIVRPKQKLLVSALLLILAGGIGNMIDRLALGYVVDFLEFTFMKFPTFNVADSFVCIGAAVLILYLIISTVKEYKNEKQSKSDELSNNRSDGGNET